MLCLAWASTRAPDGFLCLQPCPCQATLHDHQSDLSKSVSHPLTKTVEAPSKSQEPPGIALLVWSLPSPLCSFEPSCLGLYILALSLLHVLKLCSCCPFYLGTSISHPFSDSLLHIFKHNSGSISSNWLLLPLKLPQMPFHWAFYNILYMYLLFHSPHCYNNPICAHLSLLDGVSRTICYSYFNHSCTMSIKYLLNDTYMKILIPQWLIGLLFYWVNLICNIG